MSDSESSVFSHYIEVPYQYIFTFSDGSERCVPVEYVTHCVKKPNVTMSGSSVRRGRTDESHTFEIDRPGIKERFSERELDTVEKCCIGSVDMFEDDFGVRQSTHQHLFGTINEVLEDE